jgi:hypothetical protein
VKQLYEKDQVFRFPYPFVRETVFLIDGEVKNWRPGVEHGLTGGPDGDSPRDVCDGIGEQIITIVDSFRPAGWPRRVFYTRKWRDPEGKEYGKRRLFVRTAASLTVLLQGYRGEPERRDNTFVVGTAVAAREAKRRAK